MDSTPTDQKQTRRQIFTAQERMNFLELPKVEYYTHLIGYLGELGWLSPNGTGIGYQEIQSWASLTNMRLTAWEYLMIKKLSDVFAAQFSKRDINESAPYISRAETKEEAAKRLKAQMRG